MDKNIDVNKYNMSASVTNEAIKGAANTVAGPAGGAIADKIMQSRLKQNSLNNAEKSLSSNSTNENSLASDTENEISNNSAFENKSSGLFSPSSGSNNQNVFGLKGSKKNLYIKYKLVGLILSVLAIILVILAIVSPVFVVMGQIMTVRDNIIELAKNVTTGIEKFVNFAQGDGWMTEEDSFFNYLNEEYKKFPYTGGDRLDVPLIASTIHYSTTVDLDQYEELQGSVDDNKNDDFFSQLGLALTRDQTVHFYDVAKDKLGSIDSVFPGQKRLLGYSIKTDISFKLYTWAEREQALAEWKEFFQYFSNTIKSTTDDLYWETAIAALNPFTSSIAFTDIYNEMQAYLNQNGSMLAGMDYDMRNIYYEAEEFVYVTEQLLKGVENVEEHESEPSDKVGTAWILAPNIERKMNYGYDEYKKMKHNLLEMKAILNSENIYFSSDEEVLEYASNSYDEELKSLYDSYEKNKTAYMFSYTHYLQKVYVPFTFFYKHEYTQSELDSIIDEIYDQRDFYEYLVGDLKSKKGCSYGTQAGDLTELTNDEFIEFLGPIASLDYSKTKVLASVTLAQAILETGWGNYTIPDSNNLFNIKCGGWDRSNCILVDTTEEYTPGVITPIKDYFRAYGSIEDSFEDHSNLLVGYPGLTDTADYKEQVRIIKDNGYATGSNYADTLISIIEDFNLTEWDVIVDTTSSSSTCVDVPGDYANWKQYDSQWGSIPMSTAKVCNGNYCTIQNIGCLVTSLAIQIANSGVPIQNINGEFNPGSFVEVLKANNAFSPGGGLNSWYSVNIVAPTFKWQGDTFITGLSKVEKVQKINGLINDGNYIVMEVKKGCNSGQHWVAIDRVEGLNVYMFDPANPATSVWDVYDHSCVSRVVWFKEV